MTEIKAENTTLQKISDTVTAKGHLTSLTGSNENFVKDYVIQVNQDNIQILAESGNTAFVDAEFEDEEIEIEETGKIMVRDVERYKNILGRFDNSDILTLTDSYDEEDTEQGGTLTIKRENPEKQFSIQSVPPENIDSFANAEHFREKIAYDQFDDYHYTRSRENEEDDWETTNRMDGKVVMEASELREIIEDAKVINASSFPFKIEDGEFVVELGSKAEGEFHMTPETEKVENTGKSRYQYGLDGITSELQGEISLYFGNDTPLIIKKEGENHETMFLVAHRKD